MANLSHSCLCCFFSSSATNRIITAKDHASVQINIGHLDENGLYDGSFTTFALSGFVRAQVMYSCYPDISSLYAFILHINLLFVLCYHSCEMCLSFVDWILMWWLRPWFLGLAIYASKVLVWIILLKCYYANACIYPITSFLYYIKDALKFCC